MCNLSGKKKRRITPSILILDPTSFQTNKAQRGMIKDLKSMLSRWHTRSVGTGWAMPHKTIHVRMPQVSKVDSGIFAIHAVELFVRDCKNTSAPFGPFGNMDQRVHMNWFQPHEVMLGTGERPGRRTLRTVIQERLQTPEGLEPTGITRMSDDEEGTSTSPSTETEVDQTQTTPEDGVVQPHRMAVSLHNGLREATMALWWQPETRETKKHSTT